MVKTPKITWNGMKIALACPEKPPTSAGIAKNEMPMTHCKQKAT